MPLLALALAAGLAAQPAPDANELDARCVAVIALAIGNAGEKADPGLVAGLFYFIGKLDARTPGYDLEGAMHRILDAPDAGKSLEADRTRCAGIIQARGTAIQAIGERLKNQK